MITIDCLTTKLGCLSIVTYDKWNQEYEGMLLRIVDSNQLIRSRLAKKTPKKSGYFAVFWEKIKKVVIVHLMIKIFRIF